MSTRPAIFISAVSNELRSARDLVAKPLRALGYELKWQDLAANDAGDLRGVLRKWVDESRAVLQLVGHCYGFGPNPSAMVHRDGCVDPTKGVPSASHAHNEAVR